MRRAGLLHDLGRLGVSNAIWDKPGPLTDTERERVRLHPYLTDRMLARVPALGASREIAARHHERLDGSGYPRGLTAASLTAVRPAAGRRRRLPRDDRAAAAPPRRWTPRRRPGELRAEVRAGRLDGDAVDAVLRAAGHRAPARRSWPAGLTTREVEVLGLLARGTAERADRAAPRRQPEDRVEPRRAHLREDRRLQPGGGHAVRHAARPPRVVRVGG